MWQLFTHRYPHNDLSFEATAPQSHASLPGQTASEPEEGPQQGWAAFTRTLHERKWDGSLELLEHPAWEEALGRMGEGLRREVGALVLQGLCADAARRPSMAEWGAAMERVEEPYRAAEEAAEAATEAAAEWASAGAAAGDVVS